MGRKKKVTAEIIELKPNVSEQAAYEDVFPKDDPRNGMSKEQMMQYELHEQQELERRMSRFIKDAPKPDTSSIEDDEEEEIFTLDLENGKIIQKVEETIIIAPEGKMTMTAVLPPSNPYTELIADIFTSKALSRLHDELSKAAQELLMGNLHMPTPESRELLLAVETKLHNQLDELRRAWIRGTSKVNHDKIPEWAHPRIKNYIEQTIGELLSLTSGG